jgi:transforming growth factor-beta-induced protein
MKTKIRFIPVMLFATVFLFSACSKEEDVPEMESNNIVEVAQEAGSFNVLIQAALKAGLADFLSQENDLTLFAPTDEAFAALLDELGVASLDDIPATTLAQVLSYHVLGSKVMSGSLSTGYVSTLASHGNSNISTWMAA